VPRDMQFHNGLGKKSEEPLLPFSMLSIIHDYDNVEGQDELETQFEY
jgi:hypothetical protein